MIEIPRTFTNMQAQQQNRAITATYHGSKFSRAYMMTGHRTELSIKNYIAFQFLFSLVIWEKKKIYKHTYTYMSINC